MSTDFVEDISMLITIRVEETDKTEYVSQYVPN